MIFVVGINKDDVRDLDDVFGCDKTFYKKHDCSRSGMGNVCFYDLFTQ